MAEFATALNAMIERHGRLSDPIIGEWVELTEGCRMPELGQVVLLTLATKGDEDHAIIAKGLWRDGYFDSNELVSHHALVGCFYDGTYRFVRPWGSKADAIYTVTAWMPAPKPFARRHA